MSIETTLTFINNLSLELKTKASQNQSGKNSQNFDKEIEANQNQKIDNLELLKNVKIPNVKYEEIYKEIQKLEKTLNNKNIDSNSKLYNDIKIGLTPPYENFHNLSEDEQNKIKEITVDIYGAKKGMIHLITCTSVREFNDPRIKIALGEVMSYMTLEESISFGNNLQNSINDAMKNPNLLTLNEKGVISLNFEENSFINFISSIMKNNETNEKDKSLNELYEKVLVETYRRFHPFETMQNELKSSYSNNYNSFDYLKTITNLK